ncbi:MAG: TIGR01777 family protein [Chloroflexaceae bacterium]|nr:TIGR01777 family protein [Chloroflexaceae bacterium]
MTEPRRVVVTGATGLIGTRLCQILAQRGYHVTVFSRNPATAVQRVPAAHDYIAWTAAPQPAWVQALDGAYGVVHLAGASIFGKRWDEAYKTELRTSRIETTSGLVQAMQGLHHPPTVFISGSAVGYYGARDDTLLDETASSARNDFLSQLCVEWEAAAQPAADQGIRTVLLRTGIVLDPDEGALAQMKLPFTLFAGGPILPGTQWISWIHLADQVGIILHALEHGQVQGAVNATAPAPQRNRDFMATLGKVLGSPAWLPVPDFSLRLLLGEFADALVTGQRVLPRRIHDAGYTFQFPELEPALRDLLKR